MISTNKYRSEIEKISVTPEMEDRILRNLASKKNSANEMKRQPRFSWVGRAGILAAGCAIALCAFLLNPSIISSDWGKKQIQASQQAHNSERNVVQSGISQARTPESSAISGVGTTRPNGLQTQASGTYANSGVGTTRPNGLQTQASGAYSDSGVGTTKPNGLQTQVPGAYANSGAGTTKPNGLQTQTPRSSSNSGENSTKPGKLQTQSPGISSNFGESSSEAEDGPFVNTKSFDELKKAVPFTLFIPKSLPSGYKIDDITIMSGEVVQIIYSDGSNEITFRTAKGSDDISGDYTSYEKSSVVKVGDTAVTIKGNKSLICLATWIKGGCSYSLSFSSSVKEDVAVSIIASMEKA